MDKRMFQCLILKGLNDEGILVSERDIGIEKDEYYAGLDDMQKEGLIEGLKFIRSHKDNRIVGIEMNYTEITVDGMLYLEQNWF
jgi:YjcQ protein.